MNIDWVAISVIASVIAMIIGMALFARFALKSMDEDKSDH